MFKNCFICLQRWVYVLQSRLICQRFNRKEMITSLQNQTEETKGKCVLLLEQRFHALPTCQIWFWGKNRSHQGIDAWFSLDILDFAFSYYWNFEIAYHKKDIQFDIFVYSIKICNIRQMLIEKFQMHCIFEMTMRFVDWQCRLIFL